MWVVFGGKGPRRPGRGALTLLAALFVGSAIARLAGGAGEAIAREIAAPSAAAAEEEGGTAQDLSRDEIAALLAAFSDREAALTERERALEDRLHALRLAERAVEAQLADLVAAEDRLKATLAVADGAAEADVARLTSVFESMKPKDAARVFEEMDPDFAAGFVARMRPDAAAALLSGLSPASAYTISAILAGRHANVPKN